MGLLQAGPGIWYVRQAWPSPVLIMKYLVLILSLVWGACSPQPDFFTSHGTAIYTNNVPGITEDTMERSLEYFAVTFPQLIEEESVFEEDIRDILRYTVITWEPEPFRCGHGLCSGIQSGHNLRVHWAGFITNTALFHELVHEIMEFTQGVIDYEHSWTNWWKTVQYLKMGYCDWCVSHNKLTGGRVHSECLSNLRSIYKRTASKCRDSM